MYLEINNLVKSYDSNSTIIKNLSLTVDKGEFISFIGESGSGKSTFLKCLSGLEKINSGSIKLNGRVINNENIFIKPQNRNIGFVFQAYNLIPVLSARENIEMIMLLQGADEKIRKSRTDELLNQVGLYEMRNRRPSQLSGGQQQRVAVARALASKPKFILADEPTANLDTSSTSNLLDIMNKLNETEKITFIFSTHDQRVIDRARRVVTLEDGKIVNDIKK